ncbi:nucleotidyltransferase and HEPN domain-containing protein (plasmid) [Ensifer adhaerens]|uniref:nucleotidyltransferase and HEPN domain-containing protein n=1 Tax=Ensifer adhaerens TaxID=106592 RepID=UPI001CBCA763|nr:nucleotidyltransferase and HEPN domain-containing protein [Ensifer adhaerens]MBZ7927124.1 nucleotidyltransferase and HEPN domain-containing protein [Ensifer adhaerens]UAX98166.1 nucleotidyltransferase and HEPN domain-containing protein [Ensifer adhaerens]UAY05548.1 nucleotidyltransferase and HEPN domain-containing protein [Ensifer adhaerens]UAY12926.1 nucleotidyltransferase and HEPN domain-containing protein [Ensifer adhaerens]
MKTSLEHLPEKKQRELARVVEIIHEEFADALEGGSADFKKRGRILKIILFGSYARGTFVDEPHTMKGYRSDYDILVTVNSKKLAEPEYWDKATDRLMWDKGVSTPVGLIVHGAREVNNFLADGQYFFVDILREGIVLYELDDRPLAEPRPRTPPDAFRFAKEYFDDRLPQAKTFADGAEIFASRGRLKEAAFLLHQSIEQAYSGLLLVLTNYSPPSHNLKFLRGLAEDRDQRLVEAWPRDQHRFTAWYSILNEAYVKARYSKHFEITDEGLGWLLERTEHLLRLVETVCQERLRELARAADAT